MATGDASVWFVGDLDDPWVSAIADALPADARRVNGRHDSPGDWSAALIEASTAPRVVVLHRPMLRPEDAGRLAWLRATLMPPPRVILCVGPHARHHELERWSAGGLVDVVVPEATARDTIGRHVEPLRGARAGGTEAETETTTRRTTGTGPRPRVALVSTNDELRRTLADALEALGCEAVTARDWSNAVATGPALWDVPVLEPDWPRALARRSETGPVVVLLGFADRALVRQARMQGAAACLELPCDVHDLGHVLDRVVNPRFEPAHAVPPPPASGRLPTGRAEQRDLRRTGTRSP